MFIKKDLKILALGIASLVFQRNSDGNINKNMEFLKLGSSDSS